MPKRVDHEQRRRELTEALWRVAGRDGLDAVSFREVAAEAGVSVKQVQYYFGTKDRLLAEALQRVGQRIVARGMDLMAAAGTDPSPRALLHAAAVGALPNDDDSRSDTQLFFSFYIAALTDSDLASTDVLQAPRWVVPFAADLIRQAQHAGQARSDLDADQEALVFMSAFTGLSLAVLAGHETTESALAAIDYQLERIFAS